MVVHTDFLDHWKTQLLVRKLGDLAPLAVVTFWLHCHNRREDTFPLTPEKLAAICRWKGDADDLFDAMTATDGGFLDDNGDGTYTAHDWWSTNAGITSKWGNKNASKAPAEPVKNDSKTTRKQDEDESKTSPSTLISSDPSSSSNPSVRKPTQEELADYLEEIGMPRSDGEALFDKWEGSGWINGKSPIKCWKRTACSWKRQGYLASQKTPATATATTGAYDATTGTF